MGPQERLATNIRTLRLERGLSQEALGQRAKLHRTEISLIERAGRDARLSTITRIARALGVAPSALVEGIR